MDDKDVAVSTLSDSHKGGSGQDPSLLTTQALYREVSTLKDLMEQNITALKDLVFEKLLSVATQLDLIEKQRVELKKDTKDAVDAALAAAKEAVREQTLASEKAIAKSEAATKEILNQMATTFATANDANQKIIADLKERIVSLEQQKVGAKEDRTGLYAAIGVIATILGIATVILSR